MENNSLSSPEQAICERRFLDAESECKRLLTLHGTSGQPVDMKVVAWLQSLAQALEGQDKYADGLSTRLRARDMLISLMSTS